MPVRPLPFTMYCPKCGWQKRVAPMSDTLLPGNLPDICPKCGHIELLTKALRIPANVTGHSGDRDRFAHGHHAGVSFVL